MEKKKTKTDVSLNAKNRTSYCYVCSKTAVAYNAEKKKFICVGCGTEHEMVTNIV